MCVPFQYRIHADSNSWDEYYVDVFLKSGKSGNDPKRSGNDIFLAYVILKN